MPFTLVDLSKLIQEETSRLEDGLRTYMSSIRRIPTKYRFQIGRDNQSTVEFFVIARIADQVLFYQEFEEEFGIGRVGSDGVIHDWGTHPTLSITLTNFPEKASTDGAA
jgi:hypothetical protein